MSDNEYTKLQGIITTHYCYRPIFSDEYLLQDLRLKAISDLLQFFDTHKSVALFKYQQKTGTMRKTFGFGISDVKNGIPSTRTAMSVEAHWCVLKRNYLITSNSPRIDFVV